MKRPVLFFGVLLCVAAGTPAWGQIFIEEGKVALEIRPGQTIMNTVRVHNTSDKEVKVSGYWEDFQYQPPFDGTKKFFPAGTAQRSMAPWAGLSPKEFTLPPYGKQDIRYVIRVPEGIEDGHYGVLFFENMDPGQMARTGVRVITRVGCLFFLEPENRSIKKAALGEFSFEDDGMTGRLENHGNVILISEGVFYVLDEGGLVVDRGKGRSVYLPPGETVPYVLGVKEDLPPGRYTMVVTFDLSGGAVFVQEIDFEKNRGPGYQILHVRG